MKLPGLLLQIAPLGSTSQAQQALRCAYDGVRGPARLPIYWALEAVKGGHDPVLPVAFLLENPGLRQTRFLSQTVEQRVTRVLRELTRPPMRVPVRPPSSSQEGPFEEFLNLPSDLRDQVVASWQAWQGEMDRIRKMHGRIPPESQQDPARHYTVIISRLFGQKIGGQRLSKIQDMGRRFLGLRNRVFFEGGEIRPSFTAVVQILRLRAFYGLRLSSADEGRVLDALDQMATLGREEGLRLEDKTVRFHTSRRILSGCPPWLADLLIHLYAWRGRLADHMAFVLKAARLLQGVSNQEAEGKWFGSYFVDRVENGHRVRRKNFQILSTLYGIPAGRLAYAYWKTNGPREGSERLDFFPKGRGVFFDENERGKIGSYFQRTGTVGERAFFARTERDLSLGELAEASGIDRKTLERLEANLSYPEPDHVRLLCQIFLIPLDEFLWLLLKTFHPRLHHPRLSSESLYLYPSETGEVRKLQAYERKPGTFGEEVFFLRKRRFWTLSDLSQRSGISIDRLGFFEGNLVRPSDGELYELARAFGLSQKHLQEKADQTTFKGLAKSLARRITTRTGEVAWDRLRFRPTIRVFREMVAELGVDSAVSAREVNRRFSPDVEWETLSACEGRAIYIAGPDDEARLRIYKVAGVQTTGEVLFFERTNVSRNWAIREAVEKLQIGRPELTSIERNEKRPSRRQLRKFAKVYGLDYEFLVRLAGIA